VSLIYRLGQCIGNASSNPDHGGFLDAELHRDRIGCFESNAPEISCQAVGILRHDLHGIGAVGLKYPHRPGGADAVAVQEDHDLSNDLLFSPGSGDPPGPNRPDPRDFE
jgi:hypothetical protein